MSTVSEGVAKSIKALNHEEHEGHKGKEKALLRALRVLRGSLLFRAFCDAPPLRLSQKVKSLRCLQGLYGIHLAGIAIYPGIHLPEKKDTLKIHRLKSGCPFFFSSQKVKSLRCLQGLYGIHLAGIAIYPGIHLPEKKDTLKIHRLKSGCPFFFSSIASTFFQGFVLLTPKAVYSTRTTKDQPPAFFKLTSGSTILFFPVFR